MLKVENLRITRHAVRAMAERGVEVEDLVGALRAPVVVEPHEGKRRFVGENGLVAVIAGPDERPVLVTVLLRRRDQWDDDDAHDQFKG